MSRIGTIFGHIWDRASSSERQVWAPIRLPPQATADSFRPNSDYMGLRVNQLFLGANRQWFEQVEPMVLASSEYLYGDKDRTDAVVLGPRQQVGLPDRTVLLNQPVFGTQPYRGGRVTFTVVLSQMPVGNIARPVVELLTGVGRLLAPGVPWDSAGKLTDFALDGFETLTGLDGVKPVLALRLSINPDDGDLFAPGYLALVGGPPIPAQQLFVLDGLLHQGASREASKPLQERDFVLLEITKAPNGRRSDISRLPFFLALEQAEESAGKTPRGAWDEAKAHLAVAASAIRRSPDLVRTQADELVSAWIERLKEVHQRTLELTLAADTGDPAAERHRLAADILRLE